MTPPKDGDNSYMLKLVANGLVQHMDAHYIRVHRTNMIEDFHINSCSSVYEINPLTHGYK